MNLTKHIILSICLLSTALLIHAASPQPSWTKKTLKALFTLKTFDDNGQLLSSSHGFFIGNKGEAVSNLSAFKGAQRAHIIDAQGQEYAVSMLLGANDLYDVIKFRVDIKQSTPLTIATSQPQEGSRLWLQPYSIKKPSKCLEGTLTRSETINGSYAYYTITLNTPDPLVGLPFINDNGEVVGICQASSSKKDANVCYAISAEYANSLKMSGLSFNNEALRSIGIKKDLPDDLSQAVLTLYLAGTALDSTRMADYSTMIEDFILKFPTAPDGYISRAQLAVVNRQYAEADKNMSEALKVADKKDDAHFSYARMIYQKALYDQTTSYDAWSLEKAAVEAEAAYQANPLPIYRQLEAQIRFSQKDYPAAAELYLSVVGQGGIDAELYSGASQCKSALGDTVAAIALLDSAVNTFSKPYLKAAAPYLLARAYANLSAGNFRNSFNDLNEYEQLMPTEVNDRFYYVRSQAAVGGRMFQQALNDLAKAISMSPSNTLYYSEKASLEVRVGLYEDAIETATACIHADAQQSDGYLFLGLAQCLLGQRTEGCKNLEKAKELGDTQAEELIKKYGK